MNNYDSLLDEIAAYALATHDFSSEAYDNILSALMDAMGCGLLALNHKPACNLLEEPFAQIHDGIRIPGTGVNLSPVQSAFSIGALNRWLDYNDTWLAKEWGHPSDNFGALLVAGYLSKSSIQDVLTAGIIAYEIQGVIALSNAFNAVGLDHVLLVKLASIAGAGRLLNFTKEQLLAALSQCFVDGQSLRTYRHAPNTGSRKSWAAGDAGARALTLLWLTQKGETGYPTALSTPKWGFEAVLFNQQKVQLEQSFSDYVAQNILFKVSYPAEFHGQTAIEAAQILKSEIPDISKIKSVHVQTQAAGMQIISKQGPLKSPADRDHCLEYMVAVALMDEEVTDQSYLDERASDPQLEALREKVICSENPEFTKAYFDPERRAISNSVQVEFTDGTKSTVVRCDFPLGHRRRREESMVPLYNKFAINAGSRYPAKMVENILAQWRSREVTKMSVRDFWGMWPNSF